MRSHNEQPNTTQPSTLKLKHLHKHKDARAHTAHTHTFYEDPNGAQFSESSGTLSRPLLESHIVRTLLDSWAPFSPTAF